LLFPVDAGRSFLICAADEIGWPEVFLRAAKSEVGASGRYDPAKCLAEFNALPVAIHQQIELSRSEFPEFLVRQAKGKPRRRPAILPKLPVC
jgi:hypothetical protein